jgi:WD40 repeat protein
MVQGDGQMLTASGDMTIRQWDNLSSTHISSMCGHGATVKCIACHAASDDILVSGANLNQVLSGLLSPNVHSNWSSRLVLSFPLAKEC